jgi:exosome complex RNA-binding protein Csl4
MFRIRRNDEFLRNENKRFAEFDTFGQAIVNCEMGDTIVEMVAKVTATYTNIRESTLPTIEAVCFECGGVFSQLENIRHCNCEHCGIALEILDDGSTELGIPF